MSCAVSVGVGRSRGRFLRYLSMMNDFRYITSDPEILGGKPCIKGTRISVEFILELIASGGDRDAIVARYPQLSREAVEEAVRYAARFLENESNITAKVRGRSDSAESAA